jgi:hypothetical protein
VPPPHPLDADVRALRGLGFLRLERVPPPGEGGWLACADLVDGPDALDAWTRRVADGLRRTHRREPPPSVAPTYLMGWYLDAVARAGATWVLVRGRLPDLHPSVLALHETAGGWPDAVAPQGTGFSCLPGDPAADHPAATVLPDPRALHAALGDAVRAHAAAFHAAFHPPVKTGSRQRWGMVEDVLEASVWAARQLAGLPPGPLGTRRSCCFAYRVDPALLCTRCPRLA